MAPRRSAKQSSGLNQPTLSFQTRLKSTNSAKLQGKQTINAPSLRKNDSSTSLSSVERASPPVETKKAAKGDTIDLTAAKEDERLDLRPNDKAWNSLHKEAKAEMGGLPPIHGEGVTKVQDILRVFDMTSKYGPAAGITRLERWERAKRWGLDPPEQIKSILTTKQGEDDSQYRESVLYGWV